MTPQSRAISPAASPTSNKLTDTKYDRLWRWGAAHAITWAALLGIATILGRVLPGTIWNNPLIPDSFRLGLVSFGAVSLLPLSFPICTLAVLRRLVARRKAVTLFSRIARGLTVLVFGELEILLLVLYAGSWATFYATGEFVGAAALNLWRTSPALLLHHVLDLEPKLLLAIPIGAVAASALLTSGVVFVLYRIPLRACRAAVLVSVALLLYCGLSASYASVRVDQQKLQVWDPNAAVVRDFARVYHIARQDRTGPIAHAIWSIASSRRVDYTAGAVTFTVPVDTEATLQITDYLQRVHAAATQRWNVVVLVVESLRSEELMTYGGRRVVMPHVEDLAKTSRVFTRNTTNATHSDYASVVPVSSQYPLRAASQTPYPERPPYPRVLIFDVLKAVGYHTAVFSSQNEYWGGMYYYLNTGSVDHFFHSESYSGSTYVPDEDVGFTQWVSGGKHAGKIDDRITVTAANAWLDSLYASAQPSMHPFVMYVNLQNSHVPYHRPADFPPRFGTGRKSFRIGFNLFPRDSAAAVRDMYDNSLAYVDSQIGRFIAHLGALGLWEKTILVVTGDHGQAFYEHGFAAHGNVPYAELTRTPLIIHGPGLRAGQDDRPSQHIDIAPTLLSLLNLPPHPGFQGIDLTGKQPPADRPQFVVAQTHLTNAYSITRGRYTLILNWHSGFEALYDDSRDTAQKHDLGRALPALRDSLRHELDMWRQVQLQYYADTAQYRRSYPPTLHFFTRTEGPVRAATAN